MQIVDEEESVTKGPRDREELFQRLSSSSRSALALADALKEQAGQRSLRVEHLILGLAAKKDGPADRLFTKCGLMGPALRSALGEALDGPLPDPTQARLSTLSELPSLSAHAWLALRNADDLARQRGAQQIKSRHLLYGALAVEDSPVIQALVKRGARKENIVLDDASERTRTPEPAIPTAPRDAPPSNAPPSNAPPSNAPPSNAPSADAATSTTTQSTVTPRAATGRIAGFGSDRAAGLDVLGLEREVEALCSVIAARDVEPPVSIGLFGDWGTGKTFFMQEMQKWLKNLTEERRRRPNEESAYCKNIVQLWFNAWHYIDTNLWANLAEEIFDGLARALQDESGDLLKDVDDPTHARARLLAASSSARDVLGEAERVKAAAEAQKTAVTQQIECLNQHHDEIERGLGAAELVKAAYRTIAKRPDVEQQLSNAAKMLGIPELQAKTSEVKEQLVELRGLLGLVRSMARGIRNRPLATALLVVVAAGFAAGIHYAPDYAGQLLPDWFAGRADVLATLSAVLTILGPILSKATSVVKTVSGALASYDSELRTKQDERKRKLVADRELVESRLVLAEEQRRTAEERVQAVDRELARLRADQRMSEFIQERRESADYRQHLGLVARARQDFQKLSDLLSEAKTEAAVETGARSRKRELPHIDRIILYIDDLDRCPEDKVVDVLQAVHLLLAFPLFVVVVGVDSRRLLQSLKHRLGVGSTDQLREAHDGISDEERLHWQSTPLNYLEKIFQIPFTLRPMDGDGFGKLIDNLVETKVAPPAATPTSHPASAPKPVDALRALIPTNTPDHRQSVPSTPSTPAAATPNSTPTPAPALNLNPGFLAISNAERAFMKSLHVLIPSPRATKRFVNIYRLLRATVSAPVPYLEEQQYRPVLLLLAILTGHPLEATDILRDLAEGNHPDLWWDFMDSYAGQAAPPDDREDLDALAESLRWRELLDKLFSMRPLLREPQRCSAFAVWAGSVARYSFESGRVLLARPKPTRPQANAAQ